MGAWPRARRLATPPARPPLSNRPSSPPLARHLRRLLVELLEVARATKGKEVGGGSGRGKSAQSCTHWATTPALPAPLNRPPQEFALDLSPVGEDFDPLAVV